MTENLAAELCFTDMPTVDPQVVLHRVRQAWPTVEVAAEGAAAAPLVIGFPELSRQFTDGEVGSLLVAVGAPRVDQQETRERREFGQTWEWSDAEAIMSRATCTVPVNELFGAAAYRPADRVRAFVAVLRGVVETTAPIGIWWPASGLATPAAAVTGRALAGLVNVRMFSVADDPDLLLMDTLGLGSLGLPDLECVFGDLPPERMAGYLSAAAEYLVAGNTIGAGHTVQGLTSGQRWAVTSMTATVAPEREVLSIATR